MPAMPHANHICMIGNSTTKRGHTTDTAGIEIPASVRQALGLDDEPCWVVVSEYNVDEWPNGGVSPLPGKPGVFSYGLIPPGLFAQVKSEFLSLSEAGKVGGVKR